LEHFHEDFNVIAGRIGLSPDPETKNPHATNASGALADFLTPLAVNLIREKYAEDFKRFGYNLDPNEPLPRRRGLQFGVENEAAALFMRAAALENTDPAAATSELMRALSLAGWPSIYPILTKCLVAAGKPEAAWQIANEGVGRYPEHHDTLSALALLHMQRNEIERAAEIYGRLTKIAPETTKHWIALQKLLTRLGKFEEAILVASRATGMRKAMAKVQAKSGAVCLHLTRLDQALRHFDAALRLDSANKAANVGRRKTLTRLSRKAENSGDVALAATLIERALASNPEDASLQQRAKKLSRRAARKSSIDAVDG
jgi:tetratricopeptide (TPR) repeat protein